MPDVLVYGEVSLQHASIIFAAIDLWNFGKPVAGKQVRCCKHLVCIAMLLSPGSPLARGGHRVPDPLGTCRPALRGPPPLPGGLWITAPGMQG